MSRVVLHPYKMGSHSGRVLARGLGIRRIYSNRRYRHRTSTCIINWGSSKLPIGTPETAGIINHPYAVKVAGHKLEAFDAMLEAGVRCPPFSRDREIALRWQEEGHRVLARSLMRAHSGRGIIVVHPEEDLPNVPLYVKYIKKRHEFRVHVIGGEVVDTTRKMMRAGSTGNNFEVRNHSNGWIFGREGIEVSEDVHVQAVIAVEALGLDFGAVDVGYNYHKSEATVYEVNTAPGLEGTTLEIYINKLAELTRRRL